MKRRFTKLIAALALFTFLAVPLGMWGQTRDEVVSYTLEPASGTNNSYAGNCDIEISNITWNLTGNSTYQPWRIGGKSLTGVDRNLYSKTAIADNITKIEVTHGAASSITVNSWTVIVASDANFANVVSTLTPTFTANATTTINRPAGANWTNCYYKFVYNVTVSGNSNKFLEFARAKFYKENVPTYTLTDASGDNGSISFAPASPVEAGTEVTLTANPAAGYDFNGNWYFYNEEFEDVTSSIQFVSGEANKIVMPEFNLLVDAGFTEKTNYAITCAVNNDDWGTLSASPTSAYQGQTVTLSYLPETGYRLSSIAITKTEGGSATGITPVESGDGFTFEMPNYAVTATATFEAIPTYTITFIAVSGTCNTPTMSGLEGSTITLPTATPSQACVSRGWEFAGWATTSVSETTNAPTLLNGDYTITADADLYAVYQVTEEGQGVSFEYVFSEQGYSNGQNVFSATMDATSGIGWAATKGGNNDPAYYTTGSGLRVYNGGTFKVTANSNTITEVSLTFSGDDYTFTSDASNPTTWTGSQSTDITWNVSRTCRLQKVNVTYVTSTTTYNSNPSCLEIVATPTFTVAAGTYTGAQTVEINCGTTGASIYYTLDGSEPNNQSTPYNGAISIATSTTLKAIATNDGMDDSEIATAEYVIQYILTVSKDHVGFGLYDYYVDEDEQEHWDDIDVNEQTGTALVRSGANVRISVEDVDDCYLLQGFNVVDGDNNPVQVDNLMEEDGTYSFIMPASNATLTTSVNQAIEYTLTVAGLNNVTYTEMLAGVGGEEVTLTNNQATLCEGKNIDIVGLSANEGLLLQSVTLNDGTTTTTLELDNGVYHFTMPSSNATLTFTVGEIPTYTYTLATSIESGKTYIIVGEDTGDYYAMGEQKTNNRGAYAISVDGNTATVSSAEVHEVVITALGGDDEGKYTIEDGGYLYASSSNSNYLKTEATLDDNGKWAIGIAENGDATITAQGSNSRKLMRFNPNTSNNNPLFACYATNSTTGSLPRLYVKDETPAAESYTLTIDGYTDVTEGTNNRGYYLIASPVTVNPATVAGMTEGDFDLYYFDESQDEEEWRNYETANGHFNLVPGTGYLYAKKATNADPYEFTLTGAPYNGNGQVTLHKTEGTQYSGWNLIGNPWDVDATIEASREYYKMNTNGNELEPGTDHIVNAMEGIFVIANGYNDEVTFTPSNPDLANTDAMVVMNVTRNRGNVIDRAIVRFGEGGMLPKFQLNPKHTKVYFQQDNKDYAVVRSANEGEMPVSFKAETRGTYTLSVNAENVEMSYLHLIDNMTGAEVDLLQTPSYTFEAKTTDYASRFRLMFSASSISEDADGDNAFAYFNGSNWTVSNMGEATLQVVDVMGRVLSSETLSGNAEVNINQPTGVYMLRLLNENNVRVQKIVVR